MTSFVNQREGETLTIGASNGPHEYILWQVESDDPACVHFEYDDQSNGGYDIVTAVTVMRDGIHIELTSSKLVHFYFSMLKELNPEYENFILGLKKIYLASPLILEVQR